MRGEGAFTAMVVLGFAACGPSVGTPNEGGEPAPTCMSTGASVDLNGTWAVLARLSVTLRGDPSATIDLCPDPQSRITTLLLRSDITQTGTNLLQRIQLCDLVLPPINGNIMCSTAMPPNDPAITIQPAPGLLSYLRTTLVLDSLATVSATTDCATLNPSSFTFMVGALLADPTNDPLPGWRAGCTVACGPTEAWQSCVDAPLVDDPGPDGDSRPGVTLIADSRPALVSGSAYVAFRAVPTLMGTVRNSTFISGAATARIEYGLLGSLIFLSGGSCITSDQISATLPVFEVDPGASTFAQVRIDGRFGTVDRDTSGDGAVDCAEIFAQQGQIFQ